MKNKITDLRNHLFAQLERLGDEELKGEELQAEITRAKAIGQVAGHITDTARVEVDYLKVAGHERGTDFLPAPAPDSVGALPHSGQQKRGNQ